MSSVGPPPWVGPSPPRWGLHWPFRGPLSPFPTTQKQVETAGLVPRSCHSLQPQRRPVSRQRCQGGSGDQRCAPQRTWSSAAAQQSLPLTLAQWFGVTSKLSYWGRKWPGLDRWGEMEKLRTAVPRGLWGFSSARCVFGIQEIHCSILIFFIEATQARAHLSVCDFWLLETTALGLRDQWSSLA